MNTAPRGNARPDPAFDAAATFAAEPRVLRAWAASTHHPRLADAYRALAERITARVPPSPVDDTARWDAALESRFQAATSILPELSRLKWLAAARRARLSLEAIPREAPERAADADELAAIEALIADLARRIC